MIEFRHAQNTQQEYDHIYRGEYGPEIVQMESYFIWLCTLAGLKPGQRLLDISTGRGQMVQVARRLGIRATGLDFSFVACAEASGRSPSAVICGDAQRLPLPSGSFDAATNIGSLEHFEDMPRALNEMRRILKPGGVAILTVPNTFGLRWNVIVGWKTGDIDDDGQPLQRYGSRRQWTRLLEASGLQVVRVIGYEHERAWPRTRQDLKYYLTHPKILISRLFFVPFIPVNAAGQFVFFCRPAELFTEEKDV